MCAYVSALHPSAVQHRAYTPTLCLLQHFLSKDLSVNSFSFPAPLPGRLSASYEQGGEDQETKMKPSRYPSLLLQTADPILFLVWTKPSRGDKSTECPVLRWVQLSHTREGGDLVASSSKELWSLPGLPNGCPRRWQSCQRVPEHDL